MKGIYHIQHINAFHSNFKAFLQKFRGVSTKHLNSYLKWFKWIELFKDEKEILKNLESLYSITSELLCPI